MGIVSSGALWATHASALNDSKEITHFLDTRLIEIIREETNAVLAERAHDPKIAQSVDESGGLDKIVTEQTSDLAGLIRESTLSFHQPYIFSLSAITSERVRQSGLLSQWRGYGTDGGYAIIFDSLAFEDLLKEEFAQYSYQGMLWGDVYYYGMPDAEQVASEEIADAERTLRGCIRELYRAPNARNMEPAYEAMITLTCLFKHWGFHEEQEVRVIVIPPNDEVLLLSEHQGDTRKPRRISIGSRGGILVPYLDLFGNSNGSVRKLPIKQVIIGPHPLSETRRKTVELLLKSNGYDATVRISEIPYIGR